MPQTTLTEIALKAMKPPPQGQVTHWDKTLPGFGLRVSQGGAKTFVLVHGRTRERTTIGRFPIIGLADARTEAKRILAERTLGQHRPKEVSVTFKEAREAYLAEHSGRETTKKELKRLLEKHFARLDSTPLSEITDADIQKQIARLKPSEALHAFRAMRAAFRWFTRPPRRYVKHSPLEGYLAPSQDGRRGRVLTDDEIGRVFTTTEYGSPIAKLIILWGTRKGETMALRRDWIVDGILTIPSEHTKNGRPHIIPVLPMAQAILDSLPKRGPYFFPARWDDDDHLADGSWTKLHKDILKVSDTEGWGLHDLRRTFRSTLARCGVRKDLAEIMLNHAQGALDEIYNRYSYLEEKREALEKIEEWINGITAKLDMLKST